MSNEIKKIETNSIPPPQPSEQMNDILAVFQKYLDETSDEELKKDFQAINKMGIEGPTVEEYLESLNPDAMYAKGYHDGATKFKAAITNRINFLISSREKTNVEEAYVNEILPLIQETYDTE